ncbi:DSD1 family PLP-dependent enzyme [Acuticoccus kandeliae]|uniref:DSD1 family PLP-dependent enzyme n=1 Tax=Acuticoccus kandeliae TaxID=2073160 RepID=UPI000D3E5CA6|nr:DSD1 family PLP-dependent enzyme [Acuticoccus kandeliae]
MNACPAEIGMAVADVDTPAMIVDIDAFQRNLRRLMDLTEGSGVLVRPHAKTHKSSTIGKMQMEAGAVGVCCQKVGEAEALVAGGVSDVYVSNQVVGRRKLDRLARLAGRCRLAVAVDNPDNVAALAEAMATHGATIDVLVEIDVGAGRCGTRSIPQSVALAEAIARHPGLRLRGIHAYHGRAQHIIDYAEREREIQAAADLSRATAEAIAAKGITVDIISGAGTGTFLFEAGSGVYNEIQAGSYLFMDRSYREIEDEAGRPVPTFEQSLFILTTVMSVPEPGVAVVDAGLKAFSVDSGMPVVADDETIRVARASDEHGGLVLPEGRTLALGEKIRLIPGHCDPTINLHEWYVCVRDGVVVDLWPVDARGAFF